MADFNEAFSDYSLIRMRGDTLHVPFQFTTLTGAITDYKIWCYLKNRPQDTDADAVAKADTTGIPPAAAVVITDAPTKTCDAQFPASDLTAFTGKTTLFCEFQVQLKPAGDIQTVIGSQGKITFYPDIVRAIS